MYSWFGETGGGGAFVSTEIDKPHIGLETRSANSTVLISLLGALCAIYTVSGLEVYKNTCLCLSTQKLYAIYVFNSVQSNSKRFLCTSVHFNAGNFLTSCKPVSF